VCLCALSNPVCAQIQGMQLLPEGFGENPGIEAKADKILKDMCSYVGGLQQFSIEVESVFEIVLGSGQKVQFCSQGDVRLKRPNKLRVDRKGQFADVAFYYDGKSVTVFAKRKGYYATTPAPATLDETFDTARDDFGLVAPAADLFYSDAYDGLIKQAERGFFVGKNDVNGVMCNHLAFRGKSTDWQVWIQDGPKPLPMRYVLTAAGTPGAPQFEVSIRKWDTSPGLDDAGFRFVPAAGVHKIEFVKMREMAPSGAGGKQQ
jgi:hypothetical protein